MLAKLTAALVVLTSVARKRCPAVKAVDSDGTDVMGSPLRTRRDVVCDADAFAAAVRDWGSVGAAGDGEDLVAAGRLPLRR